MEGVLQAGVFVAGVAGELLVMQGKRCERGMDAAGRGQV